MRIGARIRSRSAGIWRAGPRLFAGCKQPARATDLSENVLVKGLLRRADWILGLPEDHPVKVRFDFSKACVALISDDPGYSDWVRANLGMVRAWPRRLRVEVALRLPEESFADPNSDLFEFVSAMGEADYAGLGAVLKERWLANGIRAGGLLQREAANRRASSNLRQVAMTGLAAPGQIKTILQILNEDPGVTGPQLAMETLAQLSDDRVDPALRRRWMRARKAGRGDEANQEIEAHLATELLLVLVQRGALQPGELASILEQPLARSADQWQERLGGNTSSEDWRSQRRVVHQVAKRGELVALLERNPGWKALDGRFLEKLAQDAWSARDEDAAHILARWAEIALAGEPDKNQWRQAMARIRVLRFRLARSRGDLASLAWYCDRFMESMLGAGLPLEALVGGFDVREGRHPLARMSALRLQSLAMLAASEGDSQQARELLGLAERYCGISIRARDQHGRAARWIQGK